MRCRSTYSLAATEVRQRKLAVVLGEQLEQRLATGSELRGVAVDPIGQHRHEPGLYLSARGARHLPTELPEGDACRGRDVERVDACRHRDPYGEFAARDDLVRQSVALGADHDRQPLVASDLEVVEVDGVGRRRQRQRAEAPRAQIARSRPASARRGRTER